MSDELHPVSLAAVVWDFPLVGRTRMLCEAWEREGRANTFVQFPKRRNALQRFTQGRREELGLQTVVRPRGTIPPRFPLKGERARRAARQLHTQLGANFCWERAVAFVVNPAWEPWLCELPFAKVVYDCIDDLRVHVPDPVQRAVVFEMEERLLERCDGALVTAEILGDDLHARRPELPLRLVRNGVDDHRFQSYAAEHPTPAELTDVPRPIVGFVGALYEWVDWSLIREVASAMPQVDFVFVGPRDASTSKDPCAGLANVHLLGQRAFEEVPAYIEGFDVCWVPFRVDEIGLAANPVKLYEYLALGKPVCSTQVADLDSFEDLVYRAGSSSEMIEALRGALEEGGEGGEARRAFAARNSWRARAAEVLEFAAGL